MFSRVVSLSLLLVVLGGSVAAIPQQPQGNSSAGTNRCTDLDGKELPCPPAADPAPAPAPRRRSLERSLPKNLLLDQKRFWTSPARLRERDLPWLLPFGAVTAVLIASDTGIESHLPDSPTVINRSRDFSTAGVAALIGAGGGLYLWGRVANNDHRREAGLLSGEAALGSLAVTELLKVTTRRERPLEGDGKGRFWYSGGGTSFPSTHAATAWSIATVLANEYPGPLTQVLAYGLAGGVTATRVIGRRHWSSDAFIGSALGWYFGRQVYRAHHDNDAERDNFGTFYRDPGDTARQPGNMGSPYVPLDTWIYAAFDRLEALGYVQSSFAAMRPWTRMECARLVREAADNGAEDEQFSATGRLYHSLSTEFAPEIARLDGGRNLSAQIESVYTRFIGISGKPLTDGFHFGQTVFNDYGRPYQEGANVVTGVATSAVAGPFAFYVRGEYQHAPWAAAPSQATRDAIAAMDGLPVSAAALAEVNRVRLLDAYVALNVSNWQLSFGRQSLWWGPGQSTALSFSNNAEPITMFRLTRTSPYKFPGILGLLGAIRSETFFGQLDGYHFMRLAWPDFPLYGSLDHYLDPQPFIWGQKLSFHPTPNLEFGVSTTSVLGGYGRPMTLSTFKHSFSMSGNAQPLDPGDRRTGFDFSYRIPGLRHWLVLYSDSMAEDEPSPIAYPRRSAMNPGVYLPKIPKLPKLDFRAEGVYTALPGLREAGVYYANTHYAGGYTNFGQIMGSWIGREAHGLRLASTYWFSAQTRLQVAFRRQRADREFLGGGLLRDYAVAGDVVLHPGVTLSTSVQYERWNFPVLAPDRHSNVVAAFQLTFNPRWSWGGRAQ